MRNWSKEQTKQLMELHLSGMKPEDISKRIGRPVNGVTSKLWRMKPVKKQKRTYTKQPKSEYVRLARIISDNPWIAKYLK